MFKKMIFTLLITLASTVAMAQPQGKGPRMKPEEFNQRMEGFIQQEAQLTTEEAARFFPLFHELKKQQRQSLSAEMQRDKQTRQKNLTENQYEELIEQSFQAQENNLKLERDYYKKFRKILSPSKIYKVTQAERRFHRRMLKGFAHPSHQDK